VDNEGIDQFSQSMLMKCSAFHRDEGLRTGDIEMKFDTKALTPRIGTEIKASAEELLKGGFSEDICQDARRCDPAR
jgi:hypothetical protein